MNDRPSESARARARIQMKRKRYKLLASSVHIVYATAMGLTLHSMIRAHGDYELRHRYAIRIYDNEKRNNCAVSVLCLFVYVYVYRICTRMAWRKFFAVCFHS